ncbi:hypothetical protein TNCV_4616521 [Trichonephila clavipes]|nr:hypothetical protein TNCV_4616521 [Trichonephila clavipes]
MDLKGLKQSFVSETKADNADSALLRVVSTSIKSLPEHQTMMSANMPNFTPGGGVFSMPAKNSEKSVGQNPVERPVLAQLYSKSWPRFLSIWPKMPSGSGDLVRSNIAIASRSSVNVKALDSSWSPTSMVRQP